MGELCAEKTGTVDPTKDPEGKFIYIDIGSVDVERKEVANARCLAGHAAPSRARRRVLAGDVIVSMTRPNLNAVALVGPEFSGQVCSTGFCVLRPGPRLDPRYLFHFVRTEAFVQALSGLISGALYPAVTEGQVRQQSIPLPPLAEQRRIMDILDRVAIIRRMRGEAQNTARLLVPALFTKMFGDPVFNPMGWPIKPLSEVIAGFEGGRSMKADGENRQPTRFRVLKLSAVTYGEFRPEESKPVPPDYEPDAKHIIRDGDLLITRSNTAELVGASCLVANPPPNLLMPDLIWRVILRDTSSSVLPGYLLAALQHPSVRRKISQLATGTSDSMRKLSQGRLATLQLPVPRLDMQHRFLTQAQLLNVILKAQSVAAAHERAVLAGLQARLFRA